MLKVGDIVVACFNPDLGPREAESFSIKEQHPYYPVFKQRVIEAAGKYDGLFVIHKSTFDGAIFLKSVDTGKYYGDANYSTDEGYFRKVEDAKKVTWENHIEKEKEISEKQFNEDVRRDRDNRYTKNETIYHIGLKR